MDQRQRFYTSIEMEMTVLLATSADGRVTMRAVSPARYGDDILIFTDAQSLKFRQLQENPRCCIAAGGYYAEATAKFCGATMLPENQALRDAYCKKFPDAFDEGVPFGGRGREFLLLHPTRLTGWAFENDIPMVDGVPTLPFEIDLE